MSLVETEHFNMPRCTTCIALRKVSSLVAVSTLAIALNFVTPMNPAFSQERWFQVEVSIFTNESSADREEEKWVAGRTQLNFPDNLIRLKELSDILILPSMIPPAVQEQPFQDLNASLDLSDEPEEPSIDLQTQKKLDLETSMLAVQPQPAVPGDNYSFLDFQRDSYVQLPQTESDFNQTNRALRRSSDHRLLFHGLWRQAVVAEDQATPLYINGGTQYNNHYELEGSLTVRFNEGEDRVVLDTNLWLSDFELRNIPLEIPTAGTPIEDKNTQWVLPIASNTLLASPRQLMEARNNDDDSEYDVTRVYTMRQSRPMRSTEFHYLDHPAIGVVVLVLPYEVPELVSPQFEDTQLDSPDSDTPITN